MKVMEQKLSSLQPELSDYTRREGRTIFFFMYDTIVYDEKSGHNNSFFASQWEMLPFISKEFMFSPEVI